MMVSNNFIQGFQINNRAKIARRLRDNEEIRDELFGMKQGEPNSAFLKHLLNFKFN